MLEVFTGLLHGLGWGEVVHLIPEMTNVICILGV